jgi:pyrroline-5-carboxylate reductase
MVIEAISDGGVLSGLGRELSTQLAADMVKVKLIIISTT